jgi:membrane protein
LLLGASGVFGQLQDVLNTIWEVQPRPGRGLRGFLRDRFLSFTMVLGSKFLPLVSLVVSTALSAAGKWLSGMLPFPGGIMLIANFALSVCVITFLFALIFEFVPDALITWKDVWIGTLATAARGRHVSCS